VAFDAFLKIQGIPGESGDEKHKDWIEVLGFSHGLTQAATGHARANAPEVRGRCEHRDFSITKAMDKASPLLAKYLCENKLVTEVKLEMCRAGGNKEKYLEYTLSNVIVSSISASKGSQGAGMPIEEVAFSYGKITWTYCQLDPKTAKPKGTVEFEYDLSADR
jgi:type VI secretion system secreted protein Hcp